MLPIADRRSSLTRSAKCGAMLREGVTDIPQLPMGPFVRLGDGSILGVADDALARSTDEGKSWKTMPLFADRDDIVVRPERALIRTADGTLILAFCNDAEKHWTWSDETHDAPGAVAPTYAARSTDEGCTWTHIAKLHDDWTGAIRDIIQTRTGRVVFTTMKMLHNPGRHSVMTYATDDGGVTWQAGTVIDLGGAGHHGGVTESTLVELESGRLVQYIRTNWGMFWQAVSDDGVSWHPVGPTQIDAASSPGMLFRMQSGRIALVWNRLYPEGDTTGPLTGGDWNWSATPVSNYRGELTVAFSEDECETWSSPVVLARKDEGWLAYPYLFEVQPGVLWITTMQGELRIKAREDDVLA